ncbi:hypothetical protein LV469_03050 [Peptoniphilus sp. GNH]|nr:hypothetical protein LV469_03050 [Peptoniphilus sp. GNH]
MKNALVVYEECVKGNKAYYFKTSWKRYYSGEIAPITIRINKDTFYRNYRAGKAGIECRRYVYDYAEPYIKNLIEGLAEGKEID